MSTDLTINGKKIGTDTREEIRLNVARLPSGTVIMVRVYVFRSKKPGPVLLAMGGVHGDEINGVEIVRGAIDSGLFNKLERGTVIAIPLLNIYGFINFSRDASEGKDVNRSFPGNMTGSLASRVAATITKKILPLIDCGIDFHTGGSARYNYPQIRYTATDAKAVELAKAFAAPYLIQKRNIAKSFRKIALGLNKPVLVYEGGESLRFDGFSIDHGLAGLKRMMKQLGMVDEAAPPLKPSIIFDRTTWQRAERSGLFRWSQRSGSKVGVGEPLGILNDPYGESEIKILAKKEGYIIGHNNAPVVSQGDALFNIGHELGSN